jgi:predicted component of type VI protein secretion system
MAWIIIHANGQEIDRRELAGSLILGRSPECDIPVKDIMLSRTHCRIEPHGGGWKIIDLGSKNGTHVGWTKVQTHVLNEGDWLRMGRTRLTFFTGPFEPAPQGASNPDRVVRPADPHEALTGTVTDFVFIDDEESGEHTEDSPFPQPRPLEPVSYHEEPVTNLLDELASSFWGREESGGCIGVEIAPRVTMRKLPRVVRPVRREIPQTDLSLQVDEKLIVLTPVTKKRNWWAISGIAAAALAGTAIVVMSAWLLTIAP